MALSSRCGLLRAVVCNCFARFEQHLIREISPFVVVPICTVDLDQRFYCKEQILSMLTLPKQSIEKSNLKLVDLFTHPGKQQRCSSAYPVARGSNGSKSKIYRTITRFLLKQPYIDLVHIPLFGELCYSSNIDYKYERNWVLNLLKHGIKDAIDYTLCSKAYVFKTLMAFYDCSSCDETTKVSHLRKESFVLSRHFDEYPSCLACHQQTPGNASLLVIRPWNSSLVATRYPTLVGHPQRLLARSFLLFLQFE